MQKFEYDKKCKCGNTFTVPLTKESTPDICVRCEKEMIENIRKGNIPWLSEIKSKPIL